MAVGCHLWRPHWYRVGARWCCSVVVLMSITALWALIPVMSALQKLNKLHRLPARQRCPLGMSLLPVVLAVTQWLLDLFINHGLAD